MGVGPPSPRIHQFLVKEETRPLFTTFRVNCRICRERGFLDRALGPYLSSSFYRYIIFKSLFKDYFNDQKKDNERF